MTESIGIVLAGGKATRLPNKPLLPLKNGKLVIQSSIEYLLRSNLSVIVVVPPASVLVDILPTLYREHIGFAQQEEPTGVPDAIACGTELAVAQGKRHIVAVCADNVFSEDERFDVASIPRTGQQVRVCPHWQSMHLSRYDGQWQDRGVDGSCVAGALSLPVEKALKGGINMMNFLRDNEVDAWDVPHNGWWDLGVADAYSRYWRA